MRKSEKVVGVRPFKARPPETRRDDRQHGSPAQFGECRASRRPVLLKDARYGLRGVRVGEANNPGLRCQCRYRFASSSEEEGGDVIPRMDLGSNRFAALADAETVLVGTQELEEVGTRERSSHVHHRDRVIDTIIEAFEQDLG